MKKVLIIGNHPIRQSIIDQTLATGLPMDVFPCFDAVTDANDYSDLFILPAQGINDEDTLDALGTISNSLTETDPDTSKPVCHLLLHNQAMLRLFQTLEIYLNIQRKFELYPFTIEDLWAKKVICQPSLGADEYPHLDRERIHRESNKTVHLFIDGFSSLAESLSIHAALTAHFPNYERDHSLRTRITIVDENMVELQESFIHRYKSLFEHSYYRSIDVSNNEMSLYHEPLYAKTREDFVDIEWEFVKGNFSHPIVQQKINSCADDSNQILTIALCNSNCSINLEEAFALPKEIQQKHIPVLVHIDQPSQLDKVKVDKMYDNLFPIGMEECSYDIRMPLLQMAKRLNYCYNYYFNHKTIPTGMNTEDVEKEWRKIELYSLRYSNIYHVMSLATKMRILGHHDNDWEKFYALNPDEIEQLTAVEHNRWSVDRLILGFRPPTDQEREEIRQNIQAFILAEKAGGEKPEIDLKVAYKRQKVHYDLCSNGELGEDRTGLNVKTLDRELTACIPLIAHAI